ncbi:MAG: alpha/beta hydrolase [Pseudomonadota bacterium]
MSALKRIASRLDTVGLKHRHNQVRRGWAASSCSDIAFYDSPKVQYRYRERGAGQTIVFCADPPVTLEMYDDLIDLYSQQFRVIVFELPAMGFSLARAGYTFGWEETNNDIATFIREVAGKDSILAFSCVAGLAAVDIAVRHPDLVSHLVLLQTTTVDGFDRWKAARDPKGLLATPIVGQMVMKFLIKKRAPDWFRLAVGKRQRLGDFCQCSENSIKKGAFWSLASAYQTYLDPGIVLGKPSQPMLALWGLADRSHPDENAERSTTIGSNVEHNAFENLGHFSELEDVQVVYEEIARFWQENRSTVT